MLPSNPIIDLVIGLFLMAFPIIILVCLFISVAVYMRHKGAEHRHRDSLLNLPTWVADIKREADSLKSVSERMNRDETLREDLSDLIQSLEDIRMNLNGKVAEHVPEDSEINAETEPPSNREG